MTVSLINCDRTSEQIRPYLGKNTTVPWRKFDLTSKQIRPYLEKG